MHDRTYSTDLDLPSGAVHISLTDDQMVAWVQDNVSGPLVARLLELIDQHGAQQVCIALGIASTVDLWRREHPDRWEAAITNAKGQEN
jgi:hypothetical protein